MMKQSREGQLPIEVYLLALAALFAGAAIYVSLVEASDVAVALLGGVSFVALMLLSGWALIEGLTSGVVRGFFARPSRSAEPFDYWLAASMWAVIFGSTLLIAGAIALDVLNF